MNRLDGWVCPSFERCQCGSICEAREVLEDDAGEEVAW